MALKFLNKKGWHPSNLRNLEKVWKAEQKEVAEKKKLEELKKQIEEDKKLEELHHLREQAGLAPLQQRVDFLYETGLATGKDNSEDYLLSGKKADLGQDNTQDLSNASNVPGALLATEEGEGERPVVPSANEMWQRMHSDPLLQIKQQEQQALARIRNNPVQMELLRKEAETKQRKLEKKEEKRLRKERKKARKERKKARKERKCLNEATEEGKRRAEGSESSESEDSAGLPEDVRGKGREVRKERGHTKGESREGKSHHTRADGSTGSESEDSGGPPRRAQDRGTGDMPRKEEGRVKGGVMREAAEEEAREKRDSRPARTSRGEMGDREGLSEASRESRMWRGASPGREAGGGKDAGPPRAHDVSGSRWERGVHRDPERREEGKGEGSPGREDGREFRQSSWLDGRGLHVGAQERQWAERGEGRRRSFEDRGREDRVRRTFKDDANGGCCDHAVPGGHGRHARDDHRRSFEGGGRHVRRQGDPHDSPDAERYSRRKEPLHSFKRERISGSETENRRIRSRHDSPEEDRRHREVLQESPGPETGRTRRRHDSSDDEPQRCRSPREVRHRAGKPAGSGAQHGEDTAKGSRGEGQAASENPTRRQDSPHKDNQGVEGVEGEEAEGERVRYGLSLNKRLPEALQSSVRGRAGDDEGRTDVQPKDRVERGVANKVAVKRKKMSEEEKARRLAEMTAAAEAHEAEREDRLAWAAKKEQQSAREEAARIAHKSFIAEAKKEVYGASGGNKVTIEESIKRRSHFLERGAGKSGQNAFRR